MTRIMRRVDNLDFAKDGTETPAAHTLRMVWQVDDEPPVKASLDLTVAHLEEYLESLRLLAEHADDENGGTPKRARAEIAARGSQASPVRDQGLGASRRWRGQMKKYVDQHDIRAVDGPDRAANYTPGGGWYWPHWLDRSYEHWLNTGEVVVPMPEDLFRATEGEGASFRAYIKDWDPGTETYRRDLHADLHGHRAARRRVR
jgi:hypothetical protein